MNNQCVPHWNLEDESRSLLHPSANQKKSVIVDDELVELFWRNGHIVMHNQAHRKPPTMITEFKQTQKLESPMRWGGSLGNSSDLIQEDETTPWLQCPLDDSLDKDFCLEFFTEMHTGDGTFVDKLNKEVAAAAGEKHARFGTTIETNVLSGSVSKDPSSCLHENSRLPAQSLVTGSQEQAPKPRDDAPINFSHFSRPLRADLGNLASQLGKKGSENGIKVAMGESSSKIVLSACGSNQVHNLVDISYNISDDVTGALARSVKDDVQERSPHGRAQINEFEAALTSSSGGSGCSIGRKEQNANERTSKRKRANGEESESHSQEAEYKSAKANKSVQRSTSARRSRATEVHNLSERRRRDKINEKMRALQELIPHCNKSDKASMLDEAIQYLKSLQLQVQLMWMGSGMAPVMFPGVQQYMSCMGVGMGHADMPSTHSLIHMPRGPLASQSMPSASTANHTPAVIPPTSNPLNFTTQMQSANIPEPYAHYLGYQQMQPSPQAMNLYAYGSGVDHNTPSQAAAYCSSLPTDRVLPQKTLNGHVGDAR